MGASPPPAINYRDLLTGDSRDFGASLGNWTASGATLTRDTVYKVTGTGFNASAKAAMSNAAHYIDCAIPGTFRAGVEYWAVVFLSIEETAGTHGVYVALGLQGTDAASNGWVIFPYTGAPTTGNGKFTAVAVRWRPSATRTGVTLRLTATDATLSTWHLGLARVLRIPQGDYAGGPPVLLNPSSDMGTIVPIITSSRSTISPWVGAGAGLVLSASGSADIGSSDGNSGFGVSGPRAARAAYVYTVHAIGDLIDAGINFETGVDYVGINMSEKNATTLQVYADVSTGYMLELRDRGTGKGWANSRDGITQGKIEDSFQWDFRLAGALTVSTDVAAYFQVPAKCIIDEVRVHVGAAPTGASVLVDVNIGGTTIFTTQANRPTIAVSTTDATSGTPDGGIAVAKNSVLSVDVDQIGSVIAGSNLVVFVRGRLIW